MHKVNGEATPIVNDLQHEFTNEFFGSNQYYTDFQWQFVDCCSCSQIYLL